MSVVGNGKAIVGKLLIWSHGLPERSRKQRNQGVSEAEPLVMVTQTGIHTRIPHILSPSHPIKDVDLDTPAMRHIMQGDTWHYHPKCADVKVH